MDLCWQIAGPADEIAETTVELMADFSRLLGLGAQSSEKASGERAVRT